MYDKSDVDNEDSQDKVVSWIHSGGDMRHSYQLKLGPDDITIWKGEKVIALGFG